MLLTDKDLANVQFHYPLTDEEWRDLVEELIPRNMLSEAEIDQARNMTRNKAIGFVKSIISSKGEYGLKCAAIYVDTFIFPNNDR